MLFCCHWCNVETFCHKHFVVVSRQQQTQLLSTRGKCHNLPRSSSAMLITPGCRSIDSMRWSQTLAQNCDFCLPHLQSAPPVRASLLEYCHDVWYRRTRTVWLPDDEKILKIRLFVLTECTNMTDGCTDKQTPQDGISHACIASCGKNEQLNITHVPIWFTFRLTLVRPLPDLRPPRKSLDSP